MSLSFEPKTRLVLFRSPAPSNSPANPEPFDSCNDSVTKTLVRKTFINETVGVVDLKKTQQGEQLFREMDSYRTRQESEETTNESHHQPDRIKKADNSSQQSQATSTAEGAPS